MTEQTTEPMHSEEIQEIAKAMNNLQKETMDVIADSENPFFNSKYPDLASVWSVIRKPLTDNGFSIIQTTEPTDTGVVIITNLLHVSGQWMKGKLYMPAEKMTPQKVGSAITYGRRYSLMAMVGVSPIDDDAEEAMDRPKHHKEPTPTGKKEVTASARTKLPKEEHVMIDYVLPSEKSVAFDQMKEYKPDVVLLNTEKTKIRVGKYTVETNADRTKMWSDVQNFGQPNFKADECVPMLVAGLLGKESAPFLEGKYRIKFTSEVKK